MEKLIIKFLLIFGYSFFSFKTITSSEAYYLFLMEVVFIVSMVIESRYVNAVFFGLFFFKLFLFLYMFITRFFLVAYPFYPALYEWIPFKISFFAYCLLIILFYVALFLGKYRLIRMSVNSNCS